jgi:hypothetical protein
LCIFEKRGMIDKSQAQHPAARSRAAASGAKGV